MLTTAAFHFDRAMNVLVAEASSLPDSVDPARFALQSAHTGRVAEYRLTRVEQDADRDTVAWHLTATEPGLPAATIFND